MDTKQLIKELNFKAIRSSGAGGQHVNKVSSKVVLFFNLKKSQNLTDLEKDRLSIALASKLNSEHILQLTCDESRSQHRNKEIIIERFLDIINKGLVIQKPRKATKIPKSVVRKRLDSKKKLSEKKTNRRKPSMD